MKKYLFVFLSFIFVTFFCSVSFASVDVPPDFPTSNTYDYYIIERLSDDSLRLVYFESISDIQSFTVDGHTHFALCGNFYEFHCTSDSWIYFIGGYGRIDFHCSYGTHSWNYIYSNFDIIYNGTTYLSKHEFNPPSEEQDSGLLSSLSSFFNNLFDKLASWFGSVLDYIKSIPSSIAYLFTNLGNLLSNILNSILEYIKSIPQAIVDLFSTLFEFLFIPSDNLFDVFKSMIEEKFNIIFQLASIVFDSTTIELNDSAPIFHITIYGKDYTFIDLSFYEKYRLFIHGIIILISSFNLCRWLLRNFPNIILGHGVDTDTGEVYSTLSNHK